MTPISGHQIPIGLRQARIYELNASGYPVGPSTSGSTPYEGFRLTAAQSLNITWPEPRIITAVGDDRVQVKDVLPPTEGAKGTLTASRMDHDIYAILTSTKERIQGEGSIIGINTNQQGNNPQVALIASQQSIDTSTGNRSWNSLITPKAVIYPIPGVMDENAHKDTFSVTPMIVNKHIWGEQMTQAYDGYTTTEGVSKMTYGPAWLASWVTTGSATNSFTFNPAYPAVDTNKINVYVDVLGTNGVTTEVTGGSITKTTTGFTLTTPVGASSVVIAEYQTTGSIN